MTGNVEQQNGFDLPVFSNPTPLMGEDILVTSLKQIIMTVSFFTTKYTSEFTN
jgi:hypothetical protein